MYQLLTVCDDCMYMSVCVHLVSWQPIFMAEYKDMPRVCVCTCVCAHVCMYRCMDVYVCVIFMASLGGRFSRQIFVLLGKVSSWVSSFWWVILAAM